VNERLDLRRHSVYALRMRFRTKFGAQGWCFVSLAILYAYFAFFGRYQLQRSFWGFAAAVWVWWALLRVLGQLFNYWELEAGCFRVRNFWYKKEIPWDEVTRVGSFNPKQPSSGFLEVDYSRPAPMSDRGHILANPEDRDQFIRTLRRLAPQATFEV
jgi:hypothetical protein